MLQNKRGFLDRKMLVRKKILLGELLIKAGFDHMYPDDLQTLYGMLIKCKHILKIRPELQIGWKNLGKDLEQNNSKHVKSSS